MGAAILLMREDECKIKLKMMFLVHPMLCNALGEAPLNTVPEWEHSAATFSRGCFGMLAPENDTAGWEYEHILQPGTLPDVELKKMPGTVLQTAEFDFLRRSTHKLIPRLKKAGIYLDHADYAGLPHGFGSELMLGIELMFGSSSDLYYKDCIAALNKYAC